MATEERRVERWARSNTAVGIPSEVERRTLLESPRAEQPSASERFWKSTPVALLSLVLMISGIAGVSALVSSPDLTGWRMGFDADTAVRAAAACFAFATAFVIGMGVSWLRGGRERSGSASGGVLLLCLVPAVASLLIINGDNVLDPWSPWALPVWSTATLAAVLFVLVLVASRPARGQSLERKHPVDLTMLSSGEVDELLQLRHHILQTLVDRERLAPEIVERSRELPLGQLHTLDDEAESLRRRA